MARRTKEEALATRDLILDTAELVFQRRGVSRTSLQEIAQAANLTRGAIYWHFENKADLFNAMMQRVCLPLEAMFNRLDDPGLENSLDYLRNCISEALHQTANDPQVRRVFEIATHKVEYVDELQAVRERQIAMRDEFLAHLERGFALAMQRGQLSQRMPARVAALGMHMLVDGLLQNWLLDPSAFDLEAVGAQTLDVYLRGLAAPLTPALPVPAGRKAVPQKKAVRRPRASRAASPENRAHVIPALA